MILHTAVTVATLLETVTSIVTAAIGWITSFVGEITGQPLLLMFVVFGLIGTGIGLIRRIIRL